VGVGFTTPPYVSQTKELRGSIRELGVKPLYPPANRTLLTARQHIKVNLCKLRGKETCSVGYGWPTRYNAYYLKLHDNNVTQFAVKHYSYTNATTGYLIDDFAYLLINTSAPSPIPSQIPHTLFDINNFTRCRCSLTSCPGYRPM